MGEPCGFCRDDPDTLRLLYGEWVHVFTAPDGLIYTAPCTGLDGVAFAMFASLYPHEAYEAWPDRFLTYAEQQSGKPPEAILKIMEDTQ